MNSNLDRPYHYYPSERSAKEQKHSFHLSIRAFYSFRALIVWIVLCALLIGGAFFMIPKEGVESIYYEALAHPAPKNLEECVVVAKKAVARVAKDGLVIFKPVFYLDANDLADESEPVVFDKINVDTDKDGKADVNVDTNGDGVPNLYLDKDKDGKADLDVKTVVLFSCAFASVLALLILIISLLVLIVRFFRVNSVVYEFYDDAIVVRWGVIFKKYRESKFVGVYETFYAPGRRIAAVEPVVTRDGTFKAAKYGSVCAKTPGGKYNWNLKFYGVKKYMQLYNYLESRKIDERMYYSTKTVI